ncbi:YqcI/YcgG family protein [Rhizobium sp.]|jgi:uncharacterized protein|uniref:YqcI/YcgG family protein n=1 Tax=Rhizobium sp. TaxID=391 RepID=UPI000E7FE8B2|nr:hypothetical protein [Rhizobium sp.]
MEYKNLLNRDDVAKTYANGSWQNIIFSEFATSMESSSRPYPCIFGVQGYKADQLRYIFQDIVDIDQLALALAEFVRNARTFGQNTSLVLFTKPVERIESIDDYEKRFWAILKNLADNDQDEWPAQIPTNTMSPEWEFCFADEPIFVVCNTPAHIMRQSRRASSLMLTFQPRWVFEKILGTEKAARNAFSTVRERLAHYDFVSVSPSLGRYGDPGILEHQQYFLGDVNEARVCPFGSLRDAGHKPTQQMESK